MPLLAADQPGVRDAAAAVGVEQRLFGFGMAEQLARRARMRDRAIVGCRPPGSNGFVLELDRRGGGIELLLHHAPDLGGDLFLRGGGVDQHAAIGLVRREREKAVAQPFMKRQRLAFEPVGTRCAAALCRRGAFPPWPARPG